MNILANYLLFINVFNFFTIVNFFSIFCMKVKSLCCKILHDLIAHKLFLPKFNYIKKYIHRYLYKDNFYEIPWLKIYKMLMIKHLRLKNVS